MKNLGKTAALWISVFLIFAILLKTVDQNKKDRKELKFSQFIELVKADKVAEVTYKNEGQITGNLKEAVDGRTQFETVGDTENAKWTEVLQAHNITPNYERAEKTPFWQQMLVSWAPMILLFFVFY